MTDGPIRVVVGEDDALLREGLAAMLEAAGIEVAAQAADLDHLLAVTRGHRPDVALVDVRMPPTHTDEGIQAARQIRDQLPDTGVLILSQYLEAEFVTRILDEVPGSVGYMLKDSVASSAQLATAVRRVAAGETVVDPRVVDRLIASSPLDELTAGERVVLAHMAAGLSNAAIAREMVVTERTVESHVRWLLHKLDLPADPDAHRRVRAVLAWLERR